METKQGMPNQGQVGPRRERLSRIRAMEEIMATAGDTTFDVETHSQILVTATMNYPLSS